jgi:hypothetical protein
MIRMMYRSSGGSAIERKIRGMCVHTMHENVCLCVEGNRLSWSCPVTCFWSSGAEQLQAVLSNPSEPSGLERLYLTDIICTYVDGSSSNSAVEARI